jgi:hypothetical protein
MFDPTIGRWMQEVPIGFQAGDPNLERYVANNPTNMTDPSGLAGQVQYTLVRTEPVQTADKTINGTIYVGMPAAYRDTVLDPPGFRPPKSGNGIILGYQGINSGSVRWIQFFKLTSATSLGPDLASVTNDITWPTDSGLAKTGTWYVDSKGRQLFTDTGRDGTRYAGEQLGGESWIYDDMDVHHGVANETIRLRKAGVKGSASIQFVSYAVYETSTIPSQKTLQAIGALPTQFKNPAEEKTYVDTFFSDFAAVGGTVFKAFAAVEWHGTATWRDYGLFGGWQIEDSHPILDRVTTVSQPQGIDRMTRLLRDNNPALLRTGGALIVPSGME